MSPRRKKNLHLPRRLYLKGRAYWYLDAFGTWHNLGRNYTQAMVNYAKREAPLVQSPYVCDIIDRYLKEVAPTKAASTHQAIIYSSKYLRAGLGKLDARSITKQTLYAYMDHRKHSKVNSTTAGQVRKEMRHLSMMLSESVIWGVLAENPCLGLRLGTDPKRTRYVTDGELQAFRDSATPLIQQYLDIKLLTALRKVDILNIRLEDLRDDGIHVQPTKTAKSTGKKLIIEWTPLLRDVVDRILARPRPKVIRLDRWQYLFCTRDGKPYTTSGFNSIWQRQKRKAIKEGILVENFKDSDIRAKAATDTDLTHAKALLGHADERTTRAHYRRKPERVRPIK